MLTFATRRDEHVYKSGVLLRNITQDKNLKPLFVSKNCIFLNCLLAPFRQNNLSNLGHYLKLQSDLENSLSY